MQLMGSRDRRRRVVGFMFGFDFLCVKRGQNSGFLKKGEGDIGEEGWSLRVSEVNPDITGAVI